MRERGRGQCSWQATNRGHVQVQHYTDLEQQDGVLVAQRQAARKGPRHGDPHLPPGRERRDEVEDEGGKQRVQGEHFGRDGVLPYQRGKREQPRGDEVPATVVLLGRQLGAADDRYRQVLHDECDEEACERRAHGGESIHAVGHRRRPWQELVHVLDPVDEHGQQRVTRRMRCPQDAPLCHDLAAVAPGNARGQRFIVNLQRHRREHDVQRAQRCLDEPHHSSTAFVPVARATSAVGVSCTSSTTFFAAAARAHHKIVRLELIQGEGTRRLGSTSKTEHPCIVVSYRIMVWISIIIVTVQVVYC